MLMLGLLSRYFRLTLFVLLVDNVLGELERFYPLQNSLLATLQSLQPSQHPKTIVLVCCSAPDLPKMFCMTLFAPQAKTLLDEVNALTPLKAAFPRVTPLLHLMLTLPVSTVSACELCCLVLSDRVKNYSRAYMKAYIMELLVWHESVCKILLYFKLLQPEESW